MPRLEREAKSLSASLDNGLLLHNVTNNSSRALIRISSLLKERWAGRGSRKHGLQQTHLKSWLQHQADLAAFVVESVIPLNLTPHGDANASLYLATRPARTFRVPTQVPFMWTGDLHPHNSRNRTTNEFPRMVFSYRNTLGARGPE